MDSSAPSHACCSDSPFVRIRSIPSSSSTLKPSSTTSASRICERRIRVRGVLAAVPQSLVYSRQSPNTTAKRGWRLSSPRPMTTTPSCNTQSSLLPFSGSRQLSKILSGSTTSGSKLRSGRAPAESSAQPSPQLTEPPPGMESPSASALSQACPHLLASSRPLARISKVFPCISFTVMSPLPCTSTTSTSSSATRQRGGAPAVNSSWELKYSKRLLKSTKCLASALLFFSMPMLPWKMITDSSASLAPFSTALSMMGSGAWRAFLCWEPAEAPAGLFANTLAQPCIHRSPSSLVSALKSMVGVVLLRSNWKPLANSSTDSTSPIAMAPRGSLRCRKSASCS
mmetsp:Transcript_46754/g.146573  ORF Transcript_46754/g.146573 Transcript_46754/m.146573 type:complete len:341 (-) Transcript_46754:737-1759(-)